jgi:BirA family biotin operon repressor/biotin-[acetyl-CoA-carboxylase] ligase
MTAPTFPPLFSGQDATGSGDPMDVACKAAITGCDAGLVVFDLGADRLRAAIVFAPETPLADAMIALPVCGVGFQNALGTLAPPEVAVHLGWDGPIYVNGGHCGAFNIRASTHQPQDVPDWLVIGFELLLWPENDDTGLTPNQTALYAEGCAEVSAVTLLEAWVRHTLVVLNNWLDDGAANLHREWAGLVHGIGTDTVILGQSGRLIGTDAQFGALLKQASTTTLIPLSALLKDVT